MHVVNLGLGYRVNGSAMFLAEIIASFYSSLRQLFWCSSLGLLTQKYFGFHTGFPNHKGCAYFESNFGEKKKTFRNPWTKRIFIFGTGWNGARSMRASHLSKHGWYLISISQVLMYFPCFKYDLFYTQSSRRKKCVETISGMVNQLRYSKSRRGPRSVLQRKLSMGVWYPNGFATAYNMLLLTLMCSKIPMVNCSCWIPACPFPQFLDNIDFYMICGCLGGNNQVFSN